MDLLEKQVRFARRKLMLQDFLRRLPRCLFVTLLVAAVAIFVPKLWPLAMDGQTWAWSWSAGALALGTAVALAQTLARRRSFVEAALEIDLRCGLRERVSSMVALSDEQRQSAAGQALVEDALRRVGGLDLRQQFRVQLDRRAWLPLVPAALVFVLVTLVPDREPDASAAAASQEANSKQVKRSTEVLRRKLAERKKKASEQGLKDAERLFDKLEQGTKKLAQAEDLDRKKALIELNDLARDLEKRRQSLGGTQQMREQFNKLKDIRQGPAEKLARALRDGDIRQAQAELKKLQEQLRNGELDEAAQKQLAEQMEQMQNKLNEMADAHQQAMDSLKKQIEQAQQAGALEQASKLQQQLDKLAQQGPQMDQLRQMADKLGQANQAMKDGNGQQAADALDQVAQDLEAMQQQLDELEMLDEALDQLAQAKDSMNCKSCGGAGCATCGSGGQSGAGMADAQQLGGGLGAGQGEGLRPEERTETGSYDTRVRQQVGRGRAVIEDFVHGPNVRGEVREGIKAELEAARHEEADSLTGQRLPRSHRQHAKDYFDAFREGE